MSRRPLSVGLTGGIGAGKSAALAALANLGVPTLSTDAVVHELYGDPELIDAVSARLGDTAVSNGRVDRSAIAELVFADPEALKWLEGQLWPRVGARVAAWREAAEAAQPMPEVIAIEVPLLFEAGMDAAFDYSLAVIASDETREGRAIGERLASLAEREARQLSQAEKARRADFTVENNSDLAALERNLSQILERITGQNKTGG